jgi:pimeloyl-ACP methyl ester carboxylesterase
MQVAAAVSPRQPRGDFAHVGQNQCDAGMTNVQIIAIEKYLATCDGQRWNHAHKAVHMRRKSPRTAAPDTKPNAERAIRSRFVNINSVRLHYLTAGKGDPIILLHGYAQNSHMWRPLISELARTNTVIAPDLRGFGQSAKPEGGYSKTAMAKDIRALALSLGHKRVRIAGHDIGLMVAYAYAALYPADVERIALMDAFLPGIGDTSNLFLLSDKWHFHFYGKTPLALVKGRERIYFEHFWNDFAANPARSVSQKDRRFYTKAYSRPGAMRSGFEVFRAFPQDAKEFAALARTKLKMPMLVLTGEKASGDFLISQTRQVAENVDGVVIKGAGHWLLDEAPKQVIPRLVQFLAS